MNAPTLRGRSRAMAQVYADLGPKVRAKARRLAARYGLHADDAEQDADLVFVQAYSDHDPNRGPFDVRVMFLVCGRTKDAVGALAVRRKHETHTPVDRAGAADPEPYSMGRLTRHLSADARLLIALAFDDPEESGHDAWARVRKNPDVPIPDCFRGYLEEVLGWNPNRVRAAFAEIRSAL